MSKQFDKLDKFHQKNYDMKNKTKYFKSSLFDFISTQQKIKSFQKQFLLNFFVFFTIYLNQIQIVNLN